jgi:hypothetical protein
MSILLKFLDRIYTRDAGRGLVIIDSASTRLPGDGLGQGYWFQRILVYWLLYVLFVLIPVLARLNRIFDRTGKKNQSRLSVSKFCFAKPKKLLIGTRLENK